MTVDFLGALASQAALVAAVLGLLVWLARQPRFCAKAGDLVRRAFDAFLLPQPLVLRPVPASDGQALAGLVRPVDLLLSTARPSRAPPTATDRVPTDSGDDGLARRPSGSSSR